MTREEAVSAVWAFGLSLCLSLSSTMCVVTAFDMGVSVPTLVLCCVLTALFCSACFTMPLKLIPPGAAALALGYLWQSGSLELSLEAILNRLSRQYHRAYNWDIIRWGLRTADDMEPTIVVMLCIFSAAIAMAVCWSVCRGRSALPALALSILCVATCFVVNDTVPDTVWLYLLMLGALSLLLTGKVRRQDRAQGNRLSLALVPVIALALLLLLAAVPRATYRGQGGAQRLVDAVMNADLSQLLVVQPDSPSDGSESVDLTDVGFRLESDAEVLAVRADFDGVLYLRSRAMNVYNGKSWEAWDTDPDWAALKWPAISEAQNTVTITSRYAHRMMYTPYYLSDPQVHKAPAGIINENELTEYTFACMPNLEMPSQPSTQADDWSWEQLSRYLTLPDHVKKWAQPLAKEIVGDEEDPYLRAQAIAAYVRNSAVYDTAISRMPAGQRDFVQWFLEDSDKGYCVHFASAAAVLLQAVGLPARYVTGYMTTVEAGKFTPVAAKQSHAWVEYYLPGFGWTVLEATPADLRELSQTQPTEQTLPEENVAPDMTMPEEGTELQQEQKSLWHQVLPVLGWLLGICVAGVILWAQRKLRLALRQKAFDRYAPNQQALALWQRTVLLARLAGALPDPTLYQVAEKAKYSPHTVTAQELSQFADAITSLTKQLQTRSFFHRFYYRIVLAIY